MKAYGTINLRNLSRLHKIYSARPWVSVPHYESFGSCEL